jgi:hypothetical protein
MGRFTVSNASDKAVELALEPWADVETMQPLGEVMFEYDEPAHIDFAVVKDGELAVSIWSENVEVSANGKEKHFQLPDGVHYEDLYGPENS